MSSLFLFIYLKIVLDKPKYLCIILTMKTQLLKTNDIKSAYLHQHDDGRVAIVLRLSNDLEIRLVGENPTISGFLDYETPTQRYIDEPVLIENKVGL